MRLKGPKSQWLTSKDSVPHTTENFGTGTLLTSQSKAVRSYCNKMFTDGNVFFLLTFCCIQVNCSKLPTAFTILAPSLVIPPCSKAVPMMNLAHEKQIIIYSTGNFGAVSGVRCPVTLWRNTNGVPRFPHNWTKWVASNTKKNCTLAQWCTLQSLAQ